MDKIINNRANYLYSHGSKENKAFKKGGVFVMNLVADAIANAAVHDNVENAMAISKLIQNYCESKYKYFKVRI